MEYPQLVQYSRDLKLEGDWAKSWSHSADGLTWTFHLIPNTTWSDGTPMTAADAVWSGETVLKYAAGATALRAGALEGVKSVDRPQSRPPWSSPTSSRLETRSRSCSSSTSIQSMCGRPTPETTAKTSRPTRCRSDLPTVAGGPYVISKYDAKGVTVFKPNPQLLRAGSHAQAVALSWYTNPTSLVADMDSGNLDFIDQVPFGAADSLKSQPGVAVQLGENGELPSITFNSNPAKPKNRELLNLKVKEALEYATPREQIANVVFSGYATPYANLISSQSKGDGWVNPAVQPLPLDVEQGQPDPGRAGVCERLRRDP